MNNDKEIDQLIEKYFNGETSLEEEKQLHVFFQREDLPEEMKTYKDQFTLGSTLNRMDASSFSDDDLFAKLDVQVKETKVVQMVSKTSLWTWSFRVTAAAALVVLGFWFGGQYKSNGDVDEIREELAQLKSQLSSSSASGRLQAVSNSVDGTEKPSDALVLTLEAVMKNDPNMHVRTKAVEALAKLGNQYQVMGALTEALLEENEPAVQIAIINALTSLNDRKAIESLEKLTQENDVLKEVKDEAYLSIFKLKEI